MIHNEFTLKIVDEVSAIPNFAHLLPQGLYLSSVGSKNAHSREPMPGQ